jgi:hypothetical protein
MFLLGANPAKMGAEKGILYAKPLKGQIYEFKKR